jgi:predicted transcriptional regulator of viral defense system
MKWRDFLKLVADEPIFTSAILKAGQISTNRIQQQLVRWVKADRIIQLRRGVYMVAEPYQRISPHPFLVANKLKRASFVSLQSALAHYGMIPEYVPVVTSVTVGRPEERRTEVGRFIFRHIKKSLFTGFREVEIVSSQFVFIASPEKAFLDLVYLTPKADTLDYLYELRLQNYDRVDRFTLTELADLSNNKKLIRAAKTFIEMADANEYVDL